MNRAYNRLPVDSTSGNEVSRWGMPPAFRLSRRIRRHRESIPMGFSLLEMLIVLLILVALAGTVIALMGNTHRETQSQGTLTTMAVLRETIIGKPELPGYQTDTGALPGTLADLFVQPTAPSHPPPYVGTYDPATRRGWRGPYIMNPTGKYAVDVGRGFTTAYGIANDTVMLDAWGNPIVLQRHISIDGTDDSRLVSAGRDGFIQTNPSGDVTTMTMESCGDDKVVFLSHSDERK